MNPLTNVKNIQKLSELELKRSFKTSWHDQYKDSAWIFIGGLPYDLTEGDIICVFSQYGEVVNLNLVRDKSTGKSKGFCFLCYEDQRSTVLAVDNFNGMKILRRIIRVDHVTDYKPPKESKNIDDVTKLLYETGCAPGAVVLSVGESKKTEEKLDTKEGILQNVKKVKRKKAKKPKKVSKKKLSKRTKKKRRKKDESSSSSSSSSDSSSEASSESSSSEEEEVERDERGKDRSRGKGRNKYRLDEREIENGRAFMEKVKVKMEEEEEERRRRRGREGGREGRAKEEQGQECELVNDASGEGRERREGGRWKKNSAPSFKGDGRCSGVVWSRGGTTREGSAEKGKEEGGGRTKERMRIVRGQNVERIGEETEEERSSSRERESGKSKKLH